jgi:hypothetical protein
MAMTRKEANAHMRHKYGADWYENEGAMKERDGLRRVKAAKKPAARMKGKRKKARRSPWPKSVTTKNGEKLHYTKGWQRHLYQIEGRSSADWVASAPAYVITQLKGQDKYNLVWEYEDHSDEEDHWDSWEGDDYVPEVVEKVILRSATRDQILAKIRSQRTPKDRSWGVRRNGH